jgi:hypothetical protein
MKYRFSPFNILGTLIFLWIIWCIIYAKYLNYFKGYFDLIKLISVFLIWFCIDIFIQYKLKEKKYERVVMLEVIIIIAIPLILCLVIAINPPGGGI